MSVLRSLFKLVIFLDLVMLSACGCLVIAPSLDGPCQVHIVTVYPARCPPIILKPRESICPVWFLTVMQLPLLGCCFDLEPHRCCVVPVLGRVCLWAMV